MRDWIMQRFYLYRKTTRKSGESELTQNGGKHLKIYNSRPCDETVGGVAWNLGEELCGSSRTQNNRR